MPQRLDLSKDGAQRQQVQAGVAGAGAPFQALGIVEFTPQQLHAAADTQHGSPLGGIGRELLPQATGL